IDLIAFLEAQDGVGPHVTQTLASMNGHILVPRPTIGADDKWSNRLCDFARDAGGLMSGLGTALNDGRISADEIGRLNLRGTLAELQTLLAGIDNGLDEIERGALPPPLRGN